MASLPVDDEINALAIGLGAALKRANLMLVTAESCTGGGMGQAITAVAGSSDWYDRGFITYSNAAKTEMLGVPAEAIARHGAVSEPTVRAMAAGALARSRAHIAVAITGVAGPGGGNADKPVGTVWLAWARQGGDVCAERHHFDGDRESVRRQSVAIALKGLLQILETR